MKKTLAVVLMILAFGWAAYLYGRSGSSEAQIESVTGYQPDTRLADLTGELDSLKTAMRVRLELMEHARKKQSASPRPPAVESSLRDPFASSY
ncbi:hypothetical protein HY522_02300 [bacterium]|nr:hypothetical protein [bacterium]